jgi:serine/threonine protein kinase
MPTPSVAEFWSLLVESGLVDAGAAAAARSEHEANPAVCGGADVRGIARWLTGRGLLTAWQAKRLVIGNLGPFFLGDYRLLERRGSEGNAHLFTARHEPSGREVTVVLLDPKQCRKLDVWTEVVHRTTAASQATSPMLSKTWSLEQHGTNRLIICEHVSGVPLAVELQQYGPLPELQAGVLISQLAQAVSELNGLGYPHGAVSPDVLIREPPPGDVPRTGRVRLLQFPQAGDPHVVRLRPWHTDEQFKQLGQRAAFIAPELLHLGKVCDARTDVYAIGAVLATLLVGRPPFASRNPEEILRQASERGINPAKLQQQGATARMAAVIGQLMAADPADRPADAAAAAALVAAPLGLAASDAVPPARPMTISREELPGAVAAADADELPDFSALGQSLAGRSPRSRGATEPAAASRAGVDDPAEGRAARLMRRRAARLRLIGGGITVAILAVTAAIVATRFDLGSLWKSEEVAVRPIRRPTPQPDRPAKPVRPDDSAADAADRPEGQTAVEGSDPQPAKPPPAEEAAEARQVIVDDPDLPWAAPTDGPRPTLAFLPPGSQLILLARPAAVVADAEGALFVKSLGPQAQAGLEQLTAWCGCGREGIEFLQVGWQAGPDQTVLGGYAIHLADGRSLPSDEAARRRAWGPTTATPVEGEVVHVGKPYSFWLPSWEEGRVLVVAPDTTVATGLALGGPAPSAGTPLINEIVTRSLQGRGRGSEALQAELPLELERLVTLLDADRHVTLFGSPHYLLTQGRVVLAGPLAKLAEPLEHFFGESLRAAALSVHFADNCYLELDAIATLDMPAKTLAPMLASRVEGLADTVEAYCATLNPHPYGRVLVMRLPTMLRALASYLRFGAEGDGVVINAYLPRHAAHNLALAGELALAQTPGAGLAVPPASARPAAAGALGKLEEKITLVFAKDTLEKAIQLVSEEIGVPMEIVGPDLQLEGITKNQSFGLDERDRSAREVLATILAKADPAGRLVYVVRKEDDVEAIFVTTRAAVAKRGEKLPPGQEASAEADARR